MIKSNTVFSINDGTIKFLQVSLATKKMVTAVDVISTVNQSDAQISQTLSAFIKRRKISFADSRVTLVIPRSRVILRSMVFPSQKIDEIRSMIDLQVGSRIPYSREEVEIDFQVLSKSTEGYSKVAVVIIPKDIATRYWKIFTDSKIPVGGMTISSVGLWLLYQQQADPSDKPGAIFDLDIDRSEICVCTPSHWLSSREFGIGLEQMQKEGNADILKQWELTQQASTPDKSNELSDTVYLTSCANRAYTLSIDMAKMQDDLTIKEIQLSKVLPLARGVQWPKVVSEDGVSLASLAGVAFSSQVVPIDLTPRVVKLSQEQLFYKRQLVVLGVWVLAALIALGLALGMGYFKKNVRLARLEDELRIARHEAGRVSDQLQKVHDIEGMVKGRLIFADLARTIYRLLPSQIYLVSITISDGNTLSLQGVSSSPVEINQFQKSMVDAPDFSNVSLDYVNKRVTQQGEVDYFKITCALKPLGGSS